MMILNKCKCGAKISLSGDNPWEREEIVKLINRWNSTHEACTDQTTVDINTEYLQGLLKRKLESEELEDLLDGFPLGEGKSKYGG